LIDLLAVTESEVQGVFAGRLVAAASAEEGDLLEIGSGDSNDRADGGSLSGCGQQRANLQPVASGHFVFQQDSGLIEAGDEQVKITIAIDITGRQASCNGVERAEFVSEVGLSEIVSLA
jgi:hypothetical protein